MNERAFDIGVIGAGPAGLAAAVTAAAAGLSVALIDSGSQPGGQYWRHPDEQEVIKADPAGHHDWKTFAKMRSELRAATASGRISHFPNTHVWLIDPAKEGSERRTLRLTAAYGTGRSTTGPSEVTVERLILCPGGYDRQLPVPGWDLPGVMAAGGVQALLKGSNTVAGHRALIAGTGPFLLPVATGLAEAGAEVVAICEAGAIRNWLPHLGAASQVPSKGLEGAQYAALMAKHRIPYRSRTVVKAIHGETFVEAVTTCKVDASGTPISGTEKAFAVDLVGLGWGFTPSLELPIMIGAETRRDVDGSLVAVVDDNQRSGVSGVYIAGEATGVGGASMAVAEGRLAALTAASDSGHTTSPRDVLRIQHKIKRFRRFAVAMHTAHPVPEAWTGWLDAETIVCRCEEVSYGDLCTAHDQLQADDARTMKLVARPGMGWCQGRVCGYATAGIAADLCGRDVSEDDLRSQAKRTLAAPVALSDLAALNKETRLPEAKERTS